MLTQPSRSILGCYGAIDVLSSPRVIIPGVAALMAFDAVVLVLTISRFIMIRRFPVCLFVFFERNTTRDYYSGRDGGGKGFVVTTLFRDGASQLICC